MKWVNVKETRLLDQWLHTTVTSATWADLINFFWKDMAIMAKAKEEMENSKLYASVWKDIEAQANKIVDEKCKPEWNRISEEIRPLGERVNELEKEKAAVPEDWTWEEEKEEELKGLHKRMSELTDEYQKVTDDANAELREYKDKRIDEEEWACFLLEDDEYDLIWGYVWWALSENK